MTSRNLKAAVAVIALAVGVTAVAADKAPKGASPKLMGSFSRRDAADPSIVKALKPLGLKMNHSKVIGKDGVAHYRAYKMKTSDIPAYIRDMMASKGAGK